MLRSNNVTISDILMSRQGNIAILSSYSSDVTIQSSKITQHSATFAIISNAGTIAFINNIVQQCYSTSIALSDPVHLIVANNYFGNLFISFYFIYLC